MGIQVTPEENIVFIVTNGDDTSIQHWEINIDQENIGTNLQHLDTNNYRKNELVCVCLSFLKPKKCIN